MNMSLINLSNRDIWVLVIEVIRYCIFLGNVQLLANNNESPRDLEQRKTRKMLISLLKTETGP